ncbi:hypothetical protein KVT40_001122 [Elsinoe batatas]|uniref:Uncharacterized protein n=1 Tax=Elsinoe batatas TaxID=2601811 RepID=A0A8K0PKY0_9PEZI|nr:hypothetical protein KVT40_001122 [Elsinoe batatas]
MLAHSSPIRRSNPAGICLFGHEDAPQLLSSTSSARVTITANSKVSCRYALQTAALVSKNRAAFRNGHPCAMGVLPQSDDQHDLRLVRAIRV